MNEHEDIRIDVVDGTEENAPLITYAWGRLSVRPSGEMGRRIVQTAAWIFLANGLDMEADFLFNLLGGRDV
jgi:hypothetical protein